MAKKRTTKDTGWSEIYGGMAFIIPLACLRHENLIRLSPKGCKLLLTLGRQYSGFNNGYLCVTPKVLLNQGWSSASTIWEAVAECEHYGLIEKTQQGGRNKPSYYALTWRTINKIENRMPLDVGPTLKPSNDWLKSKPPFQKPTRKKSTPASASTLTPGGTSLERSYPESD
jgi:hypothetical protein